jgi:iron transport multicopper oxidase
MYLSSNALAFIILPQNGTGRSDNTTWDDEYTLVVSDWYVTRQVVC